MDDDQEKQVSAPRASAADCVFSQGCLQIRLAGFWLFLEDSRPNVRLGVTRGRGRPGSRAKRNGRPAAASLPRLASSWASAAIREPCESKMRHSPAVYEHTIHQLAPRGNRTKHSLI